jgi:outer membrane protein TolC
LQWQQHSREFDRWHSKVMQMRLRFPLFQRFYFFLFLSTCVFSPVLRANAESLPLERAIRLALSHSTATALADVDVQKAIANYRELRDSRIPQLNAGSGIGWSNSFPLSIEGNAPSLVTVNAQSTVFNLALNRSLAASKADIRVASLQTKDQRDAVIQDVALCYAELAKWDARLVRLLEDEAQAQQIEQAVAERVDAGVDSAVDLNKAKLTSARVRLHRAEARGSADVLRQHLSSLTGLPVSAIQVDPASIPGLPPVRSDDDSNEKALSYSPAIRLAEEHSVAESMRASAEHRALLPSLDFSSQYSNIAPRLQNYTAVYQTQHLVPNNATIGAGIRFPIFNLSQHARIQAAEAEAQKARKQAEATRDKVSEETLRLERAAEQLAAARDVAKLEYELAQSGLDATKTRIEAKTAAWHELADAQVLANEHYLTYQDAEFEYQRTRMSLLRATGDLESWALPQAAPK